ncbi:MAG: sel1 repeat family protein [Bacteroidia bacterium]|nr:sel1 repeat family protein [Bacteroidia bacterium]
MKFVQYCLLLSCYCWISFSIAQNSWDSLKVAAWKGSTEAQMKLVEAYDLGLNGLPQNKDSSNRYLEMAAIGGNPDAQYMLGVAFQRGLNRKRNITKGLEWLNKAANQNHIFALRVLTEIYSTKDDEIFLAPHERVKVDSTKAFSYALRGAKLGDPQLQYYVGEAYHLGRGVKRNDTLAVAWMDSAAQKNNVFAQLKLGDWFLRAETDFKIQWNDALKYYEMAKNHPKAEIEQITEGKVGVYTVRQLRMWVRNFFLYYSFIEECAEWIQAVPK